MEKQEKINVVCSFVDQYNDLNFVIEPTAQKIRELLEDTYIGQGEAAMDAEIKKILHTRNNGTVLIPEVVRHLLK